MPQPGELRRGATEDVRWDGSRWQVQPRDQAPAGPEMHHPGVTESPSDAFSTELERTAGEAAKGLARSPLDALKALVMSPVTAVKGLSEIPEGVMALADPATWRGMAPAAAEGIKTLGDNPKEAGSLLGQLLLGEAARTPGARALGRTALEEGPGVVGRGVSKFGRGVESVGTSPWTKRAAYVGSAADVVRGDPKGALIMAAPKAIEMTGRGIQKVGGGIEGLKLAADKPVPPTPPSVVSGLTLSKDALGRNIEATNMVEDGFSHAQAGKLSGIPGAGQSKLVADLSSPQTPEMGTQDVLDNMPVPQKDWAISPEENEQVTLSRLRAAGRSGGEMPRFWVDTEGNHSPLNEDPTAQPGGVTAPDFDLSTPEGRLAALNHVGKTGDTGALSPVTQYDGQGNQIENNPDYFNTDHAPLDLLKQAAGSYDAGTAMDPNIIDAGYARNRAVVDRMRAGGLFGGDRNVRLKP